MDNALHLCNRGEVDTDKNLYDAVTTNMPPSSGLCCLAVPKQNKVTWDRNCRINPNLK